MPILGTVASQFSGKFSSFFESIATVTVGGTAQSTISFTSIPSTFTHLQIRGIARDSASLAYSYFGVRFNSDSGSNYRDHYMFGNGSTRGSGTNSLTFMENDGIPGNTATANVFGGIVIDIFDYKSTSKNKVLRALVGNDRNGTGEIYFNSGIYFATPAAITSISIIAQNGSGEFQQYSRFALYGIKG